jgi:imidazolonepropionase-like amidohydrolase
MKSMIRPAIACVCVAAAVAAAGCSTTPTVNAPGTTVLYEGARLIPGDGGAAIEDSAFLVENDTIARIGRKGEVTAPEGATRVDLTGKTVMPTLINAHGHPGFQRGLTYSAENFTRENILDDLNRAAYFGVGAIQSQGIERGDVMYQIRADQEAGKLGGALLRIAGRGIGAPNAGPGAAAYAGIAYEVTTPEEGVKSVQELAAKGVNAVKIWVDDRNGRAPRMPAPVFTAIIKEAHSHGLKVAAHVFYHTDAVELVAAGVDGLAHLVRDKEMDDALVAAIVQRNVYPMGNLSGGMRGTYDSLPPWLQESDPMMKLVRESVPAEVVQRMIDSFKDRDPKMVAAARERYGILTRSLSKLNAAGARLTLGADTGLQDHLFGLATHRELEEMVRAGMTPAQGIVAATSRPAEYMGLQTLGILAPGKLASFMVLDANPLDDITNTRRIAQVYLKGRALDREAMRARLTSSAVARAN